MPKKFDRKEDKQLFEFIKSLLGDQVLNFKYYCPKCLEINESWIYRSENKLLECNSCKNQLDFDDLLNYDEVENIKRTKLIDNILDAS